MSYAEKTSVAPEKSECDIKSLMRRYGASDFMSGNVGGEIVIAFRASERMVRFRVKLPLPDEKRFTHDNNGWLRTDKQVADRYEQEIRRLWRALLLSIKAKLETVESRIETFESAFLAQLVLPGGKTVAEEALPQIAAAYANGSTGPLLLGSGGGQ